MEMTEDVATLVLADNAAQSLALTLDGLRSASRFDAHMDMLTWLILDGIMNREDDDIPPTGELETLRDSSRGLPRPLLALMLGHVKIWAHAEGPEVRLRGERHGTAAPRRLLPRAAEGVVRRLVPRSPAPEEIIVTAAVNHVVNHAGIEFLPRTSVATEQSVGAIVEAYLATSGALGAEELRAGIHDAGHPPADTQQKLLDLEATIERGVVAALSGEPIDAGELRESLGV